MPTVFGRIERDIAGAVAPGGSCAFPAAVASPLDTPASRSVSGANFGFLPSVALHGAVLVVLLMEVAGGQQVEAPQVTLVSLVAQTAAEAAPEKPAAAAIKSFTPMPHPPAYQPPQPEPTLPELAAAKPTVTLHPPSYAAPQPPAPEPDAVAIEGAQPKPAAEKPKEKKNPVTAKAETKPQPKPAPLSQPQPSAAPVIAADNQAAAAKVSMAAALSSTTSETSTMKSGAATTPADAPVLITDPGYAGACRIRYPSRAQRRNQQGTVVIRAYIDTDGKATEVLVKSSSGFPLLDDAAKDAVEDCAFKPQTVGGRPVKAIVEIPIPFKLI